jgi:hypothetical protein
MALLSEVREPDIVTLTAPISREVEEGFPNCLGILSWEVKTEFEIQRKYVL